MVGSATISPGGSLPTPAQAQFCGEPGADLFVVRRDHRVMAWEIPFGAVFVRRHAVLRPEVALQRPQLPAILQADQVVREHRFLNFDGWHSDVPYYPEAGLSSGFG